MVQKADHYMRIKTVQTSHAIYTMIHSLCKLTISRQQIETYDFLNKHTRLFIVLTVHVRPEGVG